MTQNETFSLCDAARETSFQLHCFLRHGHKEKIHENGPLDVDVVVADELIVELNAVKCIVSEHIAQLLGYLRASRKEHGLLINFGAPKLEIRKFALSKDLDSIT